jgi:2-methylcitrate dehydratase PrpD
MPDNVEVTRHLAQFVAWTEWDALTPPVVHQAKRALINFFAVALTGCREPAIETALQAANASTRFPQRFSMPRAPMCSTSATPMCRP